MTSFHHMSSIQFSTLQLGKSRGNLHHTSDPDHTQRVSRFWLGSLAGRTLHYDQHNCIISHLWSCNAPYMYVFISYHIIIYWFHWCIFWYYISLAFLMIYLLLILYHLSFQHVYIIYWINFWYFRNYVSSAFGKISSVGPFCTPNQVKANLHEIQLSIWLFCEAFC